MQQRDRPEHVDRPVEPLPPVAEPPAPAIGRRDAKNCEAHEHDEADRQVEPQHDLGCDHAQPKVLIHRVEREMRQRVGQRGQADDPPHGQQARPVQDARRRGDRERDQQVADRPVAGAVDHLGYRPPAQRAGRPPESQHRAGDEAGRQHRRLQRQEAAVPIAPRNDHRAGPGEWRT
jgi:hypothetical protein